MSSPSTAPLLSRPLRSERRHAWDPNRYAARIVFDLLDRLLSIESVLDLGCSVGAWMQAALAKPGREALGISSETFGIEEFPAPQVAIIHAAPDQPIDLRRRFDLVLCLDAPADLEPERAAHMASNCARHSDTIVFSAAAGQPSQDWLDLFEQAGFEAVDLIRPAIRHDAGIPACYRNNLLVLVNRKAVSTLAALRRETGEAAVQDVSPEAGRVAELEADLAEQREYSGRAIRQVWALMNRLRSELALERSGRRAAERQCVELQGKLEHADRDRAELRASVSWRITAPLRAVGETLLRMRERG